MFYFFLHSYKKDILTFAGDHVYTQFSKDGPDCKEAFRLYENGDTRNLSYDQLGNKIYLCRHNLILQCLIIAKKSWGLHLDIWLDGCVEGCFSKEELLKQFYDFSIEIPEPFLKDFENRLLKKKELYWKEMVTTYLLNKK